MFKRLISSLICVTFIFSNIQIAGAQDFNVNQLPVPGTMVGESLPFAPLTLKGLIVNPQKPLEFQFIVDTGKGAQDTASIKEGANQLVKYFLAGLTIPEGDLWVNLSPYEKDRMVPMVLGQTDLGRDLLAQDYILKQLTASLIYPEKDLGKEFWSRVYAKAQKQFGTTNVPVNTFNKVWILPDQAQVFENGSAVYVTKSTLKVMLDEDYLSLTRHSERSEESKGRMHNVASQIVRDIVIPEITKEVNTGKNFAPLRQIYQALILAKWYKERIQNGLLDALYTNRNKVTGVNLNDPTVKEQIYNRYLQAYKKGVFNYIKEDPTPDGQVMPRKYFSGGTRMVIQVDKKGTEQEVEDQKPDGAMTVITIGLFAAGVLIAGRLALKSSIQKANQKKIEEARRKAEEEYQLRLKVLRQSDEGVYDKLVLDLSKINKIDYLERLFPEALSLKKEGKDFKVIYIPAVIKYSVYGVATSWDGRAYDIDRTTVDTEEEARSHGLSYTPFEAIPEHLSVVDIDSAMLSQMPSLAIAAGVVIAGGVALRSRIQKAKQKKVEEAERKREEEALNREMLEHQDIVKRLEKEIPNGDSYNKSKKIREFFPVALKLLKSGSDFEIQYIPGGRTLVTGTVVPDDWRSAYEANMPEEEGGSAKWVNEPDEVRIISIFDKVKEMIQKKIAIEYHQFINQNLVNEAINLFKKFGDFKIIEIIPIYEEEEIGEEGPPPYDTPFMGQSVTYPTGRFKDVLKNVEIKLGPPDHAMLQAPEENKDVAMFTVLKIKMMRDVDKIAIYLNNWDSDIRKAAMNRLDKVMTDPKKKLLTLEQASGNSMSDVRLWAIQNLRSLEQTAPVVKVIEVYEVAEKVRNTVASIEEVDTGRGYEPDLSGSYGVYGPTGRPGEKDWVYKNADGKEIARSIAETYAEEGWAATPQRHLPVWKVGDVIRKQDTAMSVERIAKERGIFDLSDPAVKRAHETEVNQLIPIFSKSNAEAMVDYKWQGVLPIYYTHFPDGKEGRYYLMARQFFIEEKRKGFEHPSFFYVHLLAALFYHLEHGVEMPLPKDPIAHLEELFRSNNIKNVLEVDDSTDTSFMDILNDIVKQEGGAVTSIALDDEGISTNRLGNYLKDHKVDLIISCGKLSSGGGIAGGQPAQQRFYAVQKYLEMMLQGLSDNPRAAVIANGWRSHLLLRKDDVEKVANVEVWENAFSRDMWFDPYLDIVYKGDAELNRLRKVGANLIVLRKNSSVSQTSTNSDTVMPDDRQRVDKDWIRDGGESEVSLADLEAKFALEGLDGKVKLIMETVLADLVKESQPRDKMGIINFATQMIQRINSNEKDLGSYQLVPPTDEAGFERTYSYHFMKEGGRIIIKKSVLAHDTAMLQTSKHKIKIAENGGIDLNQINVLRNGKTINVQFDQAQLNMLEQGGFEGFAPVIISIKSIKSPLPLLGISIK